MTSKADPQDAGFGAENPDATYDPRMFGYAKHVAILCGPCPALGADHLICLDADGEFEACPPIMQVWKTLPPTLTSHKGRHLFFRVPPSDARDRLKQWPDVLVTKATYDGAALDVKWAGGYACELWDWAPGTDLARLADQIAVLPGAALEALLSANAKAQTSAGVPVEGETDWAAVGLDYKQVLLDAAEWLQKEAEIPTSGTDGGTCLLKAVGGVIVGHGLGDDVARDLLLAYYFERAWPGEAPDETQLDHKIRETLRLGSDRYQPLALARAAASLREQAAEQAAIVASGGVQANDVVAPAGTNARITPSAIESIAKARGLRAQQSNILLQCVADGTPIDAVALPVVVETMCKRFPLFSAESITDAILPSASQYGATRETVLQQVTACKAKTPLAGKAIEFDFERGDHAELSDAFLARFDDVVHAEGQFWTPNADSLWCAFDQARVTREIKRFAGKVRPSKDGPVQIRISASDVAGIASLAGDECQQPEWFSGTPVCVLGTTAFAVRDGRLIREALTVEHHARWRFECEYTESEPAGLLRYFEGCFRGDADADAKRDLLQEFGGACLLGLAPRYQRSIFLTGDGENGKSQWLEVLAGIMPPGTTCSVPPQKMSDDYFAAKVMGKLLNTVSEMPQAEVVASEKFKNLVTGELTSGRPIREAPVEFRPVAGHIFAANRLPAVQDQSHGFWRRVVVVHFGRVIPKEERIRELGLKLAREERAEIVSWLLRGAERLLARGDYSLPASHEAELDAWRARADTVRLWLGERTMEPGTTSPSEWLGKVDAYRDFVAWVQASNFKGVVSRPVFFERLLGVGHSASRRALGTDGKKTSSEVFELVLKDEPGMYPNT